MENWWFLVLEFVIAISLMALSRRQPFPGPSWRYGIVLFVIAALLLIGESSPRPTNPQVHMILLLVYGGLGLIRGIHNMVKTREEVIVAPFAGFLFSISATAMMADQWPELSKFEEYAAFATIVLIGIGQTWLVFRGLLIGRLPLAWSKSGLMALQRGHINGEHGAIECFERAWDLEEEHLNPMAWFALSRINQSIGNKEEAEHWSQRMAESGGTAAIAEEWVNAIESSIKNLEKFSEEE